MGYADRDYYREMPTRPPSRLAGAPVVKWLLITNFVIFLIDVYFRPQMPANTPRGYFEPSVLGVWGEFSIQTAIMKFQVWRFITFQFLHGGFMHVAFNMLAVYMFGAYAERHWGSRPFLAYYLICGVGGALLYALLVGAGVVDGGRGIVGASAGVFGILIATAIISPEGRVMLLIPPIPMKMRTFALLYIGIETIIVLTNSHNAGGSAGHLGGAAVGFLFMKVAPMGNALRLLANTTVKVTRSGSAKTRTAKVKKKRSYEKKLRPKSKVTKAEASEIDRILDKINSEGLQSLTEEERELLTRAGGKK